LVVLTEGASRSTDEILELANSRLGKSQRLSGIKVEEKLPRSTIGKILKRELRQPYWANT